MDLRRLFNLNDINYWLLISGFALDAILTVVLLILLLQFLASRISTVSTMQLGLMIGLFIINFATAWVIGKMADDLKGPTYGLIGSIASAIIVVFVTVPAGGVFGLLAAISALAGGFNGGVATLPRGPRRGG